jgi:GT2 family glycosyltransferase
MIASFGKGKSTLTGPVVDGYGIRQSFVAEDSRLRLVRVLFSTYKRRNDGFITAKIVDRANHTLCMKQVPASSLRDNAKQEFSLSVPLVPGDIYEFRIQTLHCRSGQAPTAHYAANGHPGYLFVSGKLIPNSELVCDFEYAETNQRAEVFGGEICLDDSISSFLSERNDLLSIIILTKNQYGLISKCIRSIANNVDSPHEVIIGDTGTTDERVLGLYEQLPSHYRVVMGLDYHFSKANNLLAREYAHGGCLLFLNNDVFLEPGVVESMLDYARVYKAGAVGVRLMKMRGVIDHDGQILFKNGSVAVPDHLNVNHPIDLVDSANGITDGVTAACMLTRSAVFSTVGGFDEEYEDVYQDCDYCLKLASLGFCSVTVRTGSCLHVGSATRGTTNGSDPVVGLDRNRFLQKWGRFHPARRPIFSFVTCCNKLDVYAGFINTLPERMTWGAEMIPVNNWDNRFSVTRSLNLAAGLATGEYIVYCHQDILLCQSWMKQVVGTIEKIEYPESIGIIGFEGIQDGGTPWSCKNVKQGHVQRVQTLDELCLITPRRSLSFDESFHFHYYGADICMEAEKQGFVNYLIGVPTHHLSGGAENIMTDQDGFKREAMTFRKKWEKDIWTTTTKFLDGGIYYMILAEILNEQ